MAENKLVKTVSDYAVLIGFAIGITAYTLFTIYRNRIADLHLPPPQPRIIDNNVSQPVEEEEK